MHEKLTSICFLFLFFFIYNNKKPKLIFKRRKEMQETMQDAIAAEAQFHRITGSKF